MEELVRIIGATMIIQVPNELDHHNAEQIRTETERVLHNRNIRKIIFDFEKTNFMDSSGIGMIMGRYRSIRFTGGRVLAIRVNERIRRVLTLSGVYKYIDIYEGLPKQNEVF